MNNDELCPRFTLAFEMLGKRWTGLIIQILLRGPARFHDLSDEIPGLSDRMLNERLKELQELGIVVRKVYDQTPVLIEYSLSEKGQDLKVVMDAVEQWGSKWVELSVNEEEMV
jgi:DNA-binding HxlR family transcriptional regulator